MMLILFRKGGALLIEDIQMWLGHNSYAFTANTYVHVSKESHVQTAQSSFEKLPELAQFRVFSTEVSHGTCSHGILHFCT